MKFRMEDFRRCVEIPYIRWDHQPIFAVMPRHFAIKKASPTQDNIFPPLHVSQTTQKQLGNEVLGSGERFSPIRILNQNPGFW